MKISFFSYSDFKGGAAIAAFSIYKSIKNKKIKKNFFAVERKSKKTKSIYNSFEIFYLNCLRLLEIIIIFFTGKKGFHQSLNFFETPFLKKVNFNSDEIINLHWINRSMISLKELNKINHNILISIHDMWFLNPTTHYNIQKEYSDNFFSNYCLNMKKKILFKKNVFLVVHNKWMYKKFLSKWPKLKKKIFFCKYYPVNLNLFKPRDKFNLRKKYSLPLNKKIVLFSAQDLKDKRKGSVFFEKIINKLKYDQDIYFISLGKSKLNTDTINNYKHFDFLPHSGIADFYSLSDIYVCTSLIDNLPLSVLEAISSGCVVISFKNGGTQEVLNKIGFTFKFKEIEKLINKIRLIDKNQIRIKSAQSRNFAKKYFSQNKISYQYQNIFKNLEIK